MSDIDEAIEAFRRLRKINTFDDAKLFQEEWDRVEAALERQREGWKLVPVEPTDDMQFFGGKAVSFETTALNRIFIANRVYAEMLAAAPDPD